MRLLLQAQPSYSHRHCAQGRDAHSQGMPSFATLSARPNRQDTAEDLASRNEVDWTMWVASNRPVRSKEGALRPDLALQPTQEDCTVRLENADLFDSILSTPNGPGARSISQDVSMDRFETDLSPAQPSPTPSPSDVDFDPFDFDILPDVPGGLESVDQLAMHIPLGPWLPQPPVTSNMAGHMPWPARQS